MGCGLAALATPGFEESRLASSKVSSGFGGGA